VIIIQTYTVKAGDTLYGISNQFGVSVTDLADINNVTAATLRVGQVLNIPSNEGVNPNNMFMYTVKKGDSLYSIAMKYNTTVGQIVSLNNLKNNNLSIGQVLRIPETYTKEEEMIMPTFINYIVKKGDNLYSIARSNNVSVDTIMKDNGITNINLQVGQVLKIRTEGMTEIEECIGTDYTPPEAVSSINYTVKKGDNLYNIANKYNTSTTAISNLNNLKSNSLSIGQVLKIPNTTNSSSDKTYIVKSGDSLYTIARRFNTTVDNIKRKNNLKSNTLRIGQKLNL
jgi:LysM repeat protein